MAEIEAQYNFNPVDWTTFSDSTVLPDGYALWFYNDPELGTSKRFLLIGDGSSTADNLPKLTYTEAVAEYKTVTHANRSVVPTIGCNRITDDVLAIYGSVKDIIKQNASTISLDTSSADLARFYSSDGTDNVDLLTESYTISNVSVENNEFYCQLNLIGGFTGWGAAAASFQVNGSVTFNFS